VNVLVILCSHCNSESTSCDCARTFHFFALLETVVLVESNRCGVADLHVQRHLRHFGMLFGHQRVENVIQQSLSCFVVVNTPTTTGSRTNSTTSVSLEHAECHDVERLVLVVATAHRADEQIVAHVRCTRPSVVSSEPSA
jgi:hypothetical protein